MNKVNSYIYIYIKCIIYNKILKCIRSYIMLNIEQTTEKKRFWIENDGKIVKYKYIERKKKGIFFLYKKKE